MRSDHSGRWIPPLIVSEMDDEEDMEEEQVDYSKRKSRHVAKCEMRTKCVPQSLTLEPLGRPGVVQLPYTGRDNAPLHILNSGFGYRGLKPTGNDLICQPTTPPPPPLSCGQIWLHERQNVIFTKLVKTSPKLNVLMVGITLKFTMRIWVVKMMSLLRFGPLKPDSCAWTSRCSSGTKWGRL